MKMRSELHTIAVTYLENEIFSVSPPLAQLGLCVCAEKGKNFQIMSTDISNQIPLNSDESKKYKSLKLWSSMGVQPGMATMALDMPVGVGKTCNAWFLIGQDHKWSTLISLEIGPLI